jgi:hypothetical protein
MTESEQIIIYDTMVSIQERAPTIVAILNERSTPQERDAYKRGVYAAVVRLSGLFTPEELAAHKARHEQMRKDCDAFFASKSNEQSHRSLPGASDGVARRRGRVRDS